MTDASLGLAGVKLPNSRISFLDGVRALACLFVVIHHAYLTVYPSAEQRPTGLFGAAVNWLAYGHLGVVVFIVLSGYSLTLSPARNGLSLKGGLLEYAQRRFWRIVPTYWIALALSLLLASTVLGASTGTHWDVSIDPTPGEALLHLLLLQDFSNSASPNHVFWSVAVEWHIYLLLPVLFVLSRRLPSALIALVVLGISVLIQLSFSGSFRLLNNFALVGAFAVGVCACITVTRLRGSGSALAESFWWFLGAGLLFLSAIASVVLLSDVDIALQLCVTLASALLLVALGLSDDHMLTRILSCRFLVFIGLFSYSIYLIHAPLLQLMWQLLNSVGLPAKPIQLVVLVLATPIIVAASWIFFLIAERPFLTRKNKMAREIPLHSK